MAMPGNHTMSLLSELSRWTREHYLWELAVAKGCKAEEPDLPDEYVSAFLTTMYIHAYDFKADNVNITQPILMMSSILQDETKSQVQICRSVIAKAMNKVNGAMTYGSVFCSHLMQGYEGTVISYKTKVHDIRPFLAQFFPKWCVSQVRENGEKEQVQLQLEQDDMNACHLVDDVLNYTHRHEALENLSPIEMTMAFIFDKADTKASKALLIQDGHPLAGSHGHKPRKTNVVPQFISNPPLRPKDNGERESQDSYAAFALSNFYSDRLIHLLEGESLWDKYTYWRDNKPRNDLEEVIELDTLAFRMLDNAQGMAEARALKSKKGKFYRSQRLLLQKALSRSFGEGQEGINGGGWEGNDGDDIDDDGSDLEEDDDLGFYDEYDAVIQERIERMLDGEGVEEVDLVKKSLSCLPPEDPSKYSREAIPREVREP